MKWVVFLAIVVALLAVIFIRKSTNNVCRTFWDYYSDRDQNANCYYNPDYELEVPDIITRHGYPVETHRAVTKDGYILAMFRIPHGKKTEAKPRKPVFLQHGSTLNAGSFLTIGNKSLGFVLADAGYDVWLGNFRGSRFHEHGIYDVPAQIDLVTHITNIKIIYIFFSLGSTAGYIYCITYPNTAEERIEVFIGLAPGVFFRNMPFLVYVADTLFPLVSVPLQVLNSGKFYPRPPIPSSVFKHLCLPLPIQTEICQIIDMIVLGPNYGQNDPETLPVVLQHNSDVISVKTVTHFFQLLRSGNFHQFDYGVEENTRIYETSKPPVYDFSKIRFPNYLMYAHNDYLVTKENTELLYQILPTNTTRGIYGIKDSGFNHVDILTGKDAKTFVFDPIVDFLNNL